MFNKRCITYFVLFILSTVCSAQNCELQIKGKVIDEGTNSALDYVNILVQELGDGTTTNEEGQFVLSNLCRGEYHLIISHIGCEPQIIHIDLEQDTLLQLSLEHTPTSIAGVEIKGSANLFANQANTTVGKQTIEDNIDDNFSGLLETEAGVHILRNGTGISKPVVHGLFGNRLTILNNGIPQSGQQWGNDHSPEIDASVANRITILKGTAALEYGGSNMGSLILLEPGKIDNEPHLHGRVGYSYDTNGRGNSINAQLQQNTPVLAWRATGTFKKFGDRKTSDYFLNNTGSKEINFAFQAEKSWRDKYFLDIYASTFNTELGVLRGAHIGNLTDLESALDREVPFFTESEFSSGIDSPRQTVNHHLIKARLKNFLSDNRYLQFVVSGQLNNRKEFDVRRGNRSDIPALSLKQYSWFSDIKYHHELENNWTFNIGNQNNLTDNTNIPETDILPLIPDYFSFKNGLYSTATKNWDNTTLNVGMRYDFELQNVVTISNTASKDIIRYQNNFNNFSSIIGISSEVTKTQQLTLTTGYAMRNPAINELYSNGLHQGVSGIETGDPTLSTEKSIKSTLEYKVQPKSNFSFEALAYFQEFKDYIFLQPQDQVQLTVRGAFPVFKYQQTNARIYGFDLASQFTLANSFITRLGYSYIKGNDTSNDLPLINIPPNSFNGTLTYRSKNTLTIAGNKMEDLELEIGNRYVFRQKNLLESQDFVLPPDAYYLLNLKLSTNLILPSYKFRFLVKVENVLNSQYRDYLNRQRYFADDLGRSIVLGLNFKF